jgi:hypothetical protein
MKVVKSVFLAAVLAVPVLATSAANAATCADRSQVVQALSERYGEALYGNAVSRTGNVLEVYSNANSDTWTILVSLPEQGLSCLVAAGSGDRRLELQLANLRG